MNIDPVFIAILLPCKWLDGWTERGFAKFLRPL
jgi:hypothetical protein